MLNKASLVQAAIDARAAGHTTAHQDSGSDDDSSDDEDRPARKKAKTTKGKAKAKRGNGKIAYWQAVDYLMNCNKAAWGRNLEKDGWVP